MGGALLIGGIGFGMILGASVPQHNGQDWVQIIGAIFAGLATLFSIWNSKKVDKLDAKSEASAAESKSSLEVIRKDVNSNLSRAIETLNVNATEIAMLRGEVGMLKERLSVADTVVTAQIQAKATEKADLATTTVAESVAKAASAVETAAKALEQGQAAQIPSVPREEG